MTAATASELFDSLLATRLAPAAKTWLAQACAETADGANDARFGTLISTASRHARREPLAPSDDERHRGRQLLEGLELERWTLLETARVRLVLARRDLAQPSAVRALESAFQFADEGELCALYKSLALLPDPKRFAWRAGEGCRSNMRSVFESIACDNPFPLHWFDDVAFRQCVMKAIFVGAPVARIFGLERRRDAELERMALDLAAERRSAGRPIPDDLWLAVDPKRRPAAAGAK
jgi:hypothetical protein